MKLFACDLDGTLLNSSHGVSDVNLAAIRQLEAAGVVFAVASGRSYADIAGLLSQYSLGAAVICNNGACVRTQDGTLLYKSSLPVPVLRDYCRYMDLQHIFYAINSPDAICALNSWQELLQNEAYSTSPPAAPALLARLREQEDLFLSQRGIVYLDSFDDFLEGRRDGCSLSVVSMKEDKLRGLTDYAASDGRVVLTASGYDSLEITCPNNTKADALRLLAGHLGVDMTDTCAIGDSFNDLEMLQAAGASFAMGNAPPEIQAVCTYLTAANDQDGVALAVTQLLSGGVVSRGVKGVNIYFY